MNTMEKLSDDAIMLGGLIDGIDAIWDNDRPEAQNAMTPLLHQTKMVADQLVADIDDAGRRPAAQNAAKAPYGELMAHIGDMQTIAGKMLAMLETVEHLDSEDQCLDGRIALVGMVSNLASELNTGLDMVNLPKVVA